MKKHATSALFTDFYELTMANGYWKRGLYEHHVVFDYFFRRQPFGGGYSVFAGLGSLVEALQTFSFSENDLEYLESLSIFDAGFLDYLKNFKFEGTLYAVREGEVIFPQEPVLRIEGNLIQSQIIEGVILNTLNFQSLVATKSARVWLAANKGKIMEFGLRRAQGSDGAISATRAAFIGGAAGTSNTLAGKLFNIPVMGTMAHSWVMSFPSEIEAFRSYASIYPEATTFLIDTYNTLESGIINAITIGKELAAKGHSFGVRLDSGDIDYLSRQVRQKLDEAGFQNAKIVVSNELDETIIEHLVAARAPIDVWGVGTNLVTGGNEAAFTGVYKLAAMIQDDGTAKPVMKVSDNPEKSTNPGIKNIYRLYNDCDSARVDLITLGDEAPLPDHEITVHHPAGDYRQVKIAPSRVEPLLKKIMGNGILIEPLPGLDASRNYFSERISNFDSTYLRFLNPHIYKVSISAHLKELKLSLIKKYMRKH